MLPTRTLLQQFGAIASILQINFLIPCRSNSVVNPSRNIGEFNTTYSLEIVHGFPIEYILPIDFANVSNIEEFTIRFEASVSEYADPLFPLLFTVAQFEEITTFRLPFSYDQRNSTSQKYYSAGRTLCSLEPSLISSRDISVRVITSSPNPVKFSFIVASTQHSLLSNQHNSTFEVTPTEPVSHKFIWKTNPAVSIVRILATSEQTYCATMSIQGPYCPVHDEEANVEFDGFWQTITTKGVMTIKKKEFPEGFNIIFVLHNDDNRCLTHRRPLLGGPASIKSSRRKTVTLTLKPERLFSTWTLILAMSIPVFVSFILIGFTCILFHQRHTWLSGLTSQDFINSSLPIVEGELLLHKNLNSSEKLLNQERNGKIWQIRANLTINVLLKKGNRQMMKDSNQFYWTVIVVSIFYTIPVYQLIFHYIRVLNRTGEYDICYYNYLCSHRLWIFHDFNHFWSNILYIMFGIAFNFIVGRRERNFRVVGNEIESISKEDTGCNGCCLYGNLIPEILTNCCCARLIYVKSNHGIPPNFGVYYALGLALIMEGVLSAAYHLCPNQSNFQFDTCFMYVIAVLTILKIYQFRHPVHIGANQTFAILAGFACTSVIGLIIEVNTVGRFTGLYRRIFGTVQLILMFALSILYYAVGYIKDENGIVLTSWSMLKPRYLNQIPKTVQIDRMLFPTISIIMSAGVIIYCELKNIHFASYLLYTLIVNVFASCFYYIAIMKPLHGEFRDWTWVQPMVFFMASVSIGSLALSYFLTILTSWEKSPSESRALNDECYAAFFPFLPMYDTHDCWHFYSAIALFSAFMGLLIVDDDLLMTPQSKIPMF